MPADEYASTGTGGALKLKGAKVQKAKKKKKSKGQDKDKSAALERSMSTGSKERDGSNKDAERAATPDHGSDHEPEYKTEAERRHEEAMKKKVLHKHALYSSVKLVFDEPRGLDADFGLVPLATDATNARGSGPRIGDQKDPQRKSRKSEHLFVQAERASRHAQDWSRIREIATPRIMMKPRLSHY
ncbi:hypothetical protein NUW58_g6852 [Xylaria curta]|uniref:Uncharacterized protein n=1 Tax=Xylaria curta TaxID=42375 RepID=A0ACC1NPG1_9PEZI|nr:hypothetical protein NUW58_g6852 [Xylaria curta]